MAKLSRDFVRSVQFVDIYLSLATRINLSTVLRIARGTQIVNSDYKWCTLICMQLELYFISHSVKEMPTRFNQNQLLGVPESRMRQVDGLDNTVDDQSSVESL